MKARDLKAGKFAHPKDRRSPAKDMRLVPKALNPGIYTQREPMEIPGCPHGEKALALSAPSTIPPSWQ